MQVSSLRCDCSVAAFLAGARIAIFCGRFQLGIAPHDEHFTKVVPDIIDLSFAELVTPKVDALEVFGGRHFPNHYSHRVYA
jgi:hypothetical protein